MSTTTANMGLLIPTPGDSDYPTSINSTITAIDTHDHSSGEGVQIPTAGITDLAVTAGKLATSAVTTTKILDGAVTQAKRVALGQQVSTSSGSFSTQSSTLVDVTNLTVTITTTGRSVWVGLIPDGVSYAYLSAENNPVNVTASAKFAIVEDGTPIAGCELSAMFTVSSGAWQTSVPVGCLWTISTPAAGAHTYKVQALSSLMTAYVANAKLIAYEL